MEPGSHWVQLLGALWKMLNRKIVREQTHYEGSEQPTSHTWASENRKPRGRYKIFLTEYLHLYPVNIDRGPRPVLCERGCIIKWPRSGVDHNCCEGGPPLHFSERRAQRWPGWDQTSVIWLSSKLVVTRVTPPLIHRWASILYFIFDVIVWCFSFDEMIRLLMWQLLGSIFARWQTWFRHPLTGLEV